MIKIKKLHMDAKVSVQQGSAGLDVHTLKDVFIPPRGKVVVPTGLAIDPKGLVSSIMRRIGAMVTVEVFSRSGTSARNSIEKGAGLIDENYRNEIAVILYNHSDEGYTFKKGEKVAQLVFRPCFDPSNFMFVVDLDETERKGGFGSSGK